MAEDVDPSILKKTQDILSSIIKKPVLTEKNLKRPPFRFLHDIITNVVKTSGFLKGLYTAEEMLSENIKDKELKMTFIQKAVDVLSIVTNQTISLRPSKVVAGYEVQKTNEFLQILGTSVRKKLDSKEAVQIVLGKSPGATQKERRASIDKRPKNASEKTRSSTKTSDSTTKKSDASKTKDSEKRSHSKESKTREKEKTKEKSRSKRDDSKSRDKSETKKEKKHRREKKEESPLKSEQLENELVPNGHVDDMFSIENEGIIETESQMVNGESLMDASLPLDSLVNTKIDDNSDMSPLKTSTPTRQPSGHRSRPPSARNNRTKLEDTENKAERSPEKMSLKPNDATDRNMSIPSPVPRPPSARPSSSRPAPPRIRIRHIVENDEVNVRPPTAKPAVDNVIIDQDHHSDEEEEEFFVAEDPPADFIQASEPSHPVSEPTPDEDKGSLVKQLLETKKDLESGSQQAKKTEIDISQMSNVSIQRAREASNREMEQLRLFIQTVSKSANPLGRMLDYFQEDVDSMKAELKMWREEHRQNLAALRREKNITETTLEPLRVQLDDLDQVVQDQIDANSALKSTILRNDERIQRMLAGLKRQRS